MSAAEDLVSLIERNGGRFEIDGEEVVIRPGNAALPVIDELRLHKTELIALLQSRTGNPAGDLSPVFSPQKVDVYAEEDPLDDLRPPFVEWFDSRIHLDAKALALRQPPQWSTTVATLHRDCGQWMSGHSQVVPPTEQFRLLLRELGCSLRTIRGDEFVDYVALKDDVQAHEQFEREAP